MTFGEKLQSLRKKAGLSQEDLAEKLDITRQTVSKWELDQSTPELTYIAELARLYNVSTDYLILDDAEAPETAAPASKGGDGIDAPPKESRGVTAYRIALGSILAAGGLAGILIFLIMAQIDPRIVIDGNWRRFTGLAGYLLGSHNLLCFVLCVVLAIAGAAILAAPLVKKRRRKADNRNSAGE